jgi:hypothetical protein
VEEEASTVPGVLHAKNISDIPLGIEMLRLGHAQQGLKKCNSHHDAGSCLLWIPFMIPEICHLHSGLLPSKLSMGQVMWAISLRIS